MTRRLAVAACLALLAPTGPADARVEPDVPRMRLTDVSEASGLLAARNDRFSVGDHCLESEAREVVWRGGTAD